MSQKSPVPPIFKSIKSLPVGFNFTSSQTSDRFGKSDNGNARVSEERWEKRRVNKMKTEEGERKEEGWFEGRRGLFCIYIGDGQVIHFGAGGDNTKKTTLFRVSVISNSIPRQECPKCNYHLYPNGVTMSCLDCFLDGGELYRYGYSVSVFRLTNKWPGTCTRAKPDRVDLILHRAKYLLEHGFGKYDLWKRNCEDFALYCRTGFIGLEGGASAQAISWKTYPRYLWFHKELLGPKANVKKVEVENLAKMLQI